ncbi:MAG: hypothetical protein Q8S54_09915 [Bacteroidota bacterium]|nr:hypothetical protein [Odoribacter sp.]MDP3643491.1 hypothetical protein [Bacteroidota bacterium]
MPYRRLPNTDVARLRAIEAGLELGKRTALTKLAFSQQTLEKLQIFYPHFLGAIRQLNISKQNQFDRSKEYGEIFRKSKLYISHFLQVVNFAILRGEMKPEVIEFYGLKMNSKATPPLNLEANVLTWGERIIDGEQKRVMKGGSPIYSPSIALVKVHYEEFKETYRNQKMLQNITNRASVKVSELREQADELIQVMWNEVENSMVHLSDDEKRDKASQYGIVYVYRASEQKKTEIESLQQSIVFS